MCQREGSDIFNQIIAYSKMPGVALYEEITGGRGVCEDDRTCTLND